MPGRVFGLYFLILCHHSPQCWLCFPVDLWIIRNTSSDPIWAKELAHWSFTSAKNRFSWLFFFFFNLNHCVWYFSDKIKKKKKNSSWMNVKNFLFPLLPQLYHSTSGFVCFTVWQCLWAWCYPTIVNVRTFLKMGKTKICSSQTGLLYIWIKKNFFHCGLNTFI